MPLTDHRPAKAPPAVPLPAASSPLTLWGGFECSIVRIGDDVRDQRLELGGYERDGDFDKAASVGISKLRYPLLWETVERTPGTDDWQRHDRDLARLERLGVDPVGGLLHHGTGPTFTDFRDPDFPSRLGDFAARAARRYRHIRHWTPVNEPLTTARFSGLYGHWHPHASDETSFLRFFFIQCEAIAMAMAAIRAEIPDARLIQTEDLGRVFSTRRLRYQARFENERRWLTFDLLSGRIWREHRFFDAFLGAGIDERRLMRFVDRPCAPDVLGLDHYLTSDRFLDHRTPLGDPAAGGNGRHRYGDHAAPRRIADRALGHYPRIMETWQRYGLPIALTEVHNGCTREEQVRWLVGAWTAAKRARAMGAAVEAVTVWAMSGSVDWNSLLRHRAGYYEQGIFALRNGILHRTMVADAAESLARTGTFDHRLLDQPGWWRNPRRPVKKGAVIVLKGQGDIADAMARTLDQRNLPFTRNLAVRTLPCAHARGNAQPDRSWAQLDVSETPHENAIALRFTESGDAGFDLTIIAAAPRDDLIVCGVGLDLWLDRLRGTWSLAGVKSAHQYELRKIQNDMQPRVLASTDAMT